MLNMITNSESQTEDFAKKISGRIRSGSIVRFEGEMGAGKTAFVRGAVLAYNNTSFVSSPTFALVNDYGGTPHIYHFDMYRVTGLDDLYSTGFFDYLDDNSILFIEWSENIRDYLKEYYGDRIILIKILKTERENERMIEISGGVFD